MAFATWVQLADDGTGVDGARQVHLPQQFPGGEVQCLESACSLAMVSSSRLGVEGWVTGYKDNLARPHDSTTAALRTVKHIVADLLLQQRVFNDLLLRAARAVE